MKVFNSLTGKKTYIAAAVLLFLSGYAFWTAVPEFGILTAGLAFGLIGLGAKSDRLSNDMKIGIAALHKIAAREPLTDAEKAQLIAAGYDVFQELSAPLSPSLPGGGK